MFSIQNNFYHSKTKWKYKWQKSIKKHNKFWKTVPVLCQASEDWSSLSFPMGMVTREISSYNKKVWIMMRVKMLSGLPPTSLLEYWNYSHWNLLWTIQNFQFSGKKKKKKRKYSNATAQLSGLESKYSNEKAKSLGFFFSPSEICYSCLTEALFQ